MTDERYVYKQTEMERKMLSRGAYNKKNGSKSKMCRLPSDGMTNDEKKALNGEIMKYDLSKPMNWKQFKNMPSDLQNEYLLKLTDVIGAGRKDIAEMFGIGEQSLSDYLFHTHKGVYYFKGKKRDQESFMKWFCGDADKKNEEENETIVDEQVIEEDVVETSKKDDVARSFVEHGDLMFYGTAIQIFENMMRILDEKKKYRMRIEFDI